MKHELNCGSRDNNFEFDGSLFYKEASQFLENMLTTDMPSWISSAPQAIGTAPLAWIMEQ